MIQNHLQPPRMFFFFGHLQTIKFPPISGKFIFLSSLIYCRPYRSNLTIFCSGVNIVENIIELYRQKNKLQVQAEDAKAEMNRISKEIGTLMREGKKAEAESAKARTSEIKESIKQYDLDFATIEEKVYEFKENDYFGELALLNDQPRKASIICLSETATVVSLDKNSFKRLLGPIEEIMKQNTQRYSK